MRPGQQERIAHLFRRGFSLDLVSELGLTEGWTRDDAKAVLAELGWALDWSGRLQSRYMDDVPSWPSVAIAEPERLLNAGIDHESVYVRKAAVAVEKAIEKLRKAMLHQEQVDAAEAAARLDKRKATSAATSALRGLLSGLSAPRQAEDQFIAS